MAFVGPHHGPKIFGKNHQSTTKVTLNEPPITTHNIMNCNINLFSLISHHLHTFPPSNISIPLHMLCAIYFLIFGAYIPFFGATDIKWFNFTLLFLSNQSTLNIVVPFVWNITVGRLDIIYLDCWYIDCLNMQWGIYDNLLQTCWNHNSVPW